MPKLIVSTLRRIPDLEFLFGHSHSTLCSLELAALNRSSGHLRRAKAEMNDAVAQREVAGVARWLIENRETLLEAARNSLPVIAVTKKLRLPKTCICGCPRLAHLRGKCKQHGCPKFSLKTPYFKVDWRDFDFLCSLALSAGSRARA